VIPNKNKRAFPTSHNPPPPPPHHHHHHQGRKTDCLNVTNVASSIINPKPHRKNHQG